MGYAQEIRTYTLAEYLELEEVAEYKSEFYNGEIFAMSGGTPEHSRITANCISALTGAFDPRGCDAYDGSLRIHIERLNAVLYPDASVICEPLQRDLASRSLVRNPSLILEVLSKSTAVYDRGSKFHKYQMIPSLKTYVLVEQTEPRVYVYHKNEQGDWGVSHYHGLEEEVQLTPLGVSISMAQIYKRVRF